MSRSLDIISSVYNYIIISLDVYKRQVPLVKGSSVISSLLFTHMLPVSYTHLDVYKRQGHNILPHSALTQAMWKGPFL